MVSSVRKDVSSVARSSRNQRVDRSSVREPACLVRPICENLRTAVRKNASATSGEIGVLPSRALTRLFRNAVFDLMIPARDSVGTGFIAAVRGRLGRFKRAVAVLLGLFLARRHSRA